MRHPVQLPIHIPIHQHIYYLKASFRHVTVAPLDTVTTSDRVFVRNRLYRQWQRTSLKEREQILLGGVFGLTSKPLSKHLYAIEVVNCRKRRRVHRMTRLCVGDVTHALAALYTHTWSEYTHGWNTYLVWTHTEWAVRATCMQYLYALSSRMILA